MKVPGPITACYHNEIRVAGEEYFYVNQAFTSGQGPRYIENHSELPTVLWAEREVVSLRPRRAP